MESEQQIPEFGENYLAEICQITLHREVKGTLEFELALSTFFTGTVRKNQLHSTTKSRATSKYCENIILR
jgi:hypothetical protein